MAPCSSWRMSLAGNGFAATDRGNRPRNSSTPRVATRCLSALPSGLLLHYDSIMRKVAVSLVLGLFFVGAISCAEEDESGDEAALEDGEGCFDEEDESFTPPVKARCASAPPGRMPRRSA